MEIILPMRRFAGILALLAALTSPARGGSSSIEIDRIKPGGEQGLLKVDSAGNVVDPECRLMASEIAQRISQNRVSGPVAKGAIARHTEECNKLRETQYKQMEENQRKMSEDRAREAEEKSKNKAADKSACIEKCRTTCAANCPPATITGGTAASGLITADSPCPVACPPKDVCEKRCAK
jgi:ribosomal protein S28E/S33